MLLPSVPMTEQRLWALYCVLDFSYREITEEVTDWAWKDVKYGLQRKWNLSRADRRHVETNVAIHMGVGRALGFDMDSLRSEVEIPLVIDAVSVCVNDARQTLQEQVIAGAIGWDVLDALDTAGAIDRIVRLVREAKRSHAA